MPQKTCFWKTRTFTSDEPQYFSYAKIVYKKDFFYNEIL